MTIDFDKLNTRMESFLKEAAEVQHEVDFLHHQMNSTIKCMNNVTNQINKLQEHEMFDDLPEELKQTLFNITGAKK